MLLLGTRVSRHSKVLTENRRALARVLIKHGGVQAVTSLTCRFCCNSRMFSEKTFKIFILRLNGITICTGQSINTHYLGNNKMCSSLEGTALEIYFFLNLLILINKVVCCRIQQLLKVMMPMGGHSHCQ